MCHSECRLYLLQFYCRQSWNLRVKILSSQFQRWAIDPRHPIGCAPKSRGQRPGPGIKPVMGDRVPHAPKGKPIGVGVRLLAQSKARTQSTAAAGGACWQPVASTSALQVAAARAATCRQARHWQSRCPLALQASRPGPPANGELASEVAVGA